MSDIKAIDVTTKSTVAQIRSRFDADVERFSDLQAGQAATIDSPLHMELLTDAAAATTPNAVSMLDIGCGAGNYALKLLQRLPHLQVTLIDLSRPMLDRAVKRISEVTPEPIQAVQSDVRQADLGQQCFDIVLAAQTLHHLRSDAEWYDVFSRVFTSLRSGGSFWIADSVAHDSPVVEAMMHRRWGEYLVQLQDESYRDHVFAYVQKEDTPRSLGYQLDLMRTIGFKHIDVLHKNSRAASFGGVKAQ